MTPTEKGFKIECLNRVKRHADRIGAISREAEIPYLTIYADELKGVTLTSCHGNGEEISALIMSVIEAMDANTGGKFSSLVFLEMLEYKGVKNV
jgi:hypothetical protein